MALTMCTLCPNRCVLPQSGRGQCRIRINLDGDVYALTYGRPCAVHVDPIEKKPAYHFLPGSRSFSIATAGCCLECKYCQNWQISQARPEDAYTYNLFPEAVIASALKARCKSIAYTYTEPTVFFEYMIDTARLARQKNIANVFVTCGFINEKPLAELAQVLDVANIDLKAFTDEVYVRMTRGHLAPVQHCIKYLYQKGVIVEITNLIVPTLNDNMNHIRDMCTWVAHEVSPDVPIHFARFYPHYKLKHLSPTPVSTLKEARDIAHEVGLRYVYLGNIREREGQNTVCPTCGAVLIERIGYSVQRVTITHGRCSSCGESIYGRWE